MFDVIVIGGGPGGYVCAIRAAQNGLNVACVESRATLGGTCLNVGCIPSKALLTTTEHFHLASHGFSEHGIDVGSVKIDVQKMIERKNKVVKQNVGGIDFLFKKNKVTRILGHGKIVSANKVEVAGQVYETKNIVIATGSEPRPLSGVSFDGKRVISSTEALDLTEVPKELLVVGAGVIGLELGSVWARLGAKVSVIEFGEVLLPGNDPLVQRTLQKSLEELGMQFYFGVGVTESLVSSNRVQLKAKDKSGTERTFEGDYALVAIGRKPYTENLGLENIGVVIEKNGTIPVDEHCRTKVSGVFAIGDVVRGPMLAHKAEDEGVFVADQIAGKYAHINYDVIPGVVYTHPEVATVGKTEEALKAEGREFVSGKFNFGANGRALAMGQAIGFVKIIADKKTDQVLGVHMIGPQVSELIHEAALAMEFKASSEDIAMICHAHPTLSEAVKEAALAVQKRSIHGA